MKKLIIATAVICSLGLSAAFAAGDVNQTVQELKTEFKLNDQQAERIQRIMGGEATDAQKSERRAKRMERRMARMQEELGLTDEQVTKIKALREGQQESMKTSREANRAAIEALLTPEQKEKFSEMKGKRGHKMGKRGGRGHGGDCGHGKRRGKHGGEEKQG